MAYYDVTYATMQSGTNPADGCDLMGQIAAQLEGFYGHGAGGTGALRRPTVFRTQSSLANPTEIILVIPYDVPGDFATAQADWYTNHYAGWTGQLFSLFAGSRTEHLQDC